MTDIQIIQKPSWLLLKEFVEACGDDLLTIKVPVRIADEIVYLMTDNDVLYDNRIALCDTNANATEEIKAVGKSLSAKLVAAQAEFHKQIVE